ncbi:MAG: Ribosome hibernation promoting factor [Thermocaproicibacter melissae]
MFPTGKKGVYGMKLTFIGRKVNLKDNFKELAAKKLSRFDRLFGDDAEAKVVVTVEKNHQTVEITIFSRGMIYRAEARANEMNVALDEVIASLGSQIRRNKKRLNKKFSSAELLIPESDSSEEDYEENSFQIVRRKRFAVKPMSVDEAILQMELLDHQFFMFRNEETGDISVVYRRRGGGYGLLEPEPA